MKTRKELLASLQEDVEMFGGSKVVFAWFQHFEGYGNVLMDYSLEETGMCNDPELLSVLLDLIEEDCEERPDLDEIAAEYED